MDLREVLHRLELSVTERHLREVRRAVRERIKIHVHGGREEVRLEQIAVHLSRSHGIQRAAMLDFVTSARHWRHVHVSRAGGVAEPIEGASTSEEAQNGFAKLARELRDAKASLRWALRDDTALGMLSKVEGLGAASRAQSLLGELARVSQRASKLVVRRGPPARDAWLKLVFIDCALFWLDMKPEHDQQSRLRTWPEMAKDRPRRGPHTRTDFDRFFLTLVRGDDDRGVPGLFPEVPEARCVALLHLRRPRKRS